MSHSDFIHLRVHTAYSLLEGAIKVKDLAKICADQSMPAVAMTDTGNLFGTAAFSDCAAKAGVQPIIGCQLFLDYGEEELGTASVVLLAKDEQGYQNLSKLVSKSFLETDPVKKASVHFDDLKTYHEGLILLTGGAKGYLGKLVLLGKEQYMREVFLELKHLFKDRLYIEIQRHETEEESITEPLFLKLAYDYEVPLVATNEVFFEKKEMYEAHDALLCIAGGRYVSEENRRKVTPEYYFKTTEEMKALFKDLPEAIENTVLIAKRCAYMFSFRSPLLPPYPTEGMSETEYLKIQSEKGLKERLKNKSESEQKPYFDRLYFELDVIGQMGFPGYFLIVADFISWAKEKGIPVGPGRGSGAGSVVAWALTITDLDPLRWDLLFERFLNPERISMPDFDIDFCQERREEVIHYVQEKYGYDHVAQIITFGTLQARAVLRDVGRVLQMPYSQVDRICKLVPSNPAHPVSLQEAIDLEPQLKQMKKEDEQVAYLLNLSMQLEGLYRHASTHAAGVVIGDRPLTELVPLYRDPKSDMPVTQFDLKWIEGTGLIKFDFLGLKTLTVLNYAVQFIQDKGRDVDLSDLPLNDPKTFSLLGKGETVGVFQLESSGMRDVLTKLKPDKFEDVVGIVALYRPGPMDNIPSYIDRKHGKEVVEYLHPKLEGILKDTYGFMIYQEQVMQAAQILAGYSLGSADLLRRAMGKKIKEEMDKQREVFIKGCEENQIDKSLASQIFDQIAKFAGYGFNKAHATSYALISYQTAYLKANYPVEFMAALMTLDYTNTDKLHLFKQELQRLEIDLLMPDINQSEAFFSVEDGKVRYGLAAIKNVGEAAMTSLVEERKTNGPFKDMGDFISRVDAKVLNRRQMENLIKAGAFDCLEPHRACLYNSIDMMLSQAHALLRDKETHQSSLFEDAGEGMDISLDKTEEWSDVEKLQNEFEAVGFIFHLIRCRRISTFFKRMILFLLKMWGRLPVAEE